MFPRKDLSNDRRAVFCVGLSQDVITKTGLEVSSVGSEAPFREDLSTEAEE
jgi:hypothetical protein